MSFEYSGTKLRSCSVNMPKLPCARLAIKCCGSIDDDTVPKKV